MGNSCCKKDYHKKNRPSNDSNAPAAELSKSLDANDIAAAQAAIDEEEAEALSTDAEEVLASSFVVNLVQDPVKAGEILKRSEWKKEWKRRFLVLKNGHLYSCKDANTNPNNILFLNPRTDVVHADSQNISEKNKRVMGERTGSFKVTDDKGQSFYLAPVSPDTMGFNDWVHVLETTIENMKQLERYKEALLPKLQRGTTFVKKNFSTLGALSTRDQHRVVSVSADCRSVLWHKPEVAEFDDIPFDEITNIVSGAETPVFKRQRKSLDVACCFSIVTNKRTLDLVASDAGEAALWIEGLRAVKKFGSVLTDEQLETLTWEKRAKVAKSAAQAVTDQRRKDERREMLSSKLKGTRGARNEV